MKEFIEKLIARLEESRQECHKLQKTTTDAYGYMKQKQGIDIAKEIVNELAEEYNGWIPCSERLPKEKGFYIVTQEIYSFDGKRLLRTVTKADTLFNPVNQKWNISDNLKVIAWQPLPEPYKIEDKPQESKQEWKDSVMSHFTKVE